MENEKKLIVQNNNNLFNKIKQFFRKMFKKEVAGENKYEVIINQKTKENFENNIKIQEDNEEKRLLKLQALIREEVITEEEIPEEDKKSLHELYNKQILSLKEQIDEYKEKILAFQKES